MYLLLAVAGALTLHAQAGPAYETVAFKNVMIPSDDGVKLAADVYLPAQGGSVAPGRFPAVVERSPYNKDDVAPALINYFVGRAYAVVIEDVRGRYKSEGRWRPLRDDGADGAALLRWIGQQPWSNGKAGSMGTSYNGATQHAMAIANAPHLSAMVPVDAMSNCGRYGVRHNGAFNCDSSIGSSRWEMPPGLGRMRRAFLFRRIPAPRPCVRPRLPPLLPRWKPSAGRLRITCGCSHYGREPHL